MNNDAAVHKLVVQQLMNIFLIPKRGEVNVSHEWCISSPATFSGWARRDQISGKSSLALAQRFWFEGAPQVVVLGFRIDKLGVEFQ